MFYLFLLSKYLQVDLLGRIVSIWKTTWEPAKVFSKGSVSFWIVSEMHESSSSFISLPLLDIAILFHCSHTHCDFNICLMTDVEYLNKCLLATDSFFGDQVSLDGNKQHYSFRFLQYILTNIQNRQNSVSVSSILHRPFPKVIIYFLDSFKFLPIFWRRQLRHVVYTNQLWAFLLKIRPVFYF